MQKEELLEVFLSLKVILSKYEKKLVVVKGSEDSYYLDTTHIQKNKKPMFFGSVTIKKNYVSFHLMPVYCNPKLLEGMSPELKKRMQGKSCFNFKTVDKALFKELAKLTKAGLDDFKQAGYLE